MSSTHYMDLLMQNSPWNLVLFMVIPVVLAESIAISELFLLYYGKSQGRLDTFRKVCGVLAGIAFAAIMAYLITVVFVPLTTRGEWRTWVDVVAVAAYILAGVPMILIALLNLRVLARQARERTRQLLHIVFLSVFLVFSHVAMVFGMVDPVVAGYVLPAKTGHAHMHMTHGHLPVPTEAPGDHAVHGHHH